MFSYLCTECLNWIYVWAFTSGIDDAGSDDSHKIMLYDQGISRQVTLPNLPGNDMESSKGDLWKIPMSSFGVFPDVCVTPRHLDGLSIHAGGGDGWNIRSIITTGILNNGMDFFLTADLEVYRWVDSGDVYAADKFLFPLTDMPEWYLGGTFYGGK